jgi:hypothetical protein
MLATPPAASQTAGFYLIPRLTLSLRQAPDSPLLGDHEAIK